MMYRKALDGGIWIPRRITPQSPPLGFTVGKDQNHYYKILDTCPKRKTAVLIKQSCGCRREEWYCEEKQVSRILCEICQKDWWAAEYPDAVDYTK